MRQPGFKNCVHKASANGYAESDKVMRGGMLMACHHGLNEIQINHMLDSVSEFIKSIK
jgi:CDP-6-deoxy-D-xylo-4-hexulose-3-dehydrase